MRDVESSAPYVPLDPTDVAQVTWKRMVQFGIVLILVGAVEVAFALPTAFPVFSRASLAKGVYDIQGHRGSRGATVESTLPAFAWYVFLFLFGWSGWSDWDWGCRGLIYGAKTLEMDNGVTKDGK